MGVGLIFIPVNKSTPREAASEPFFNQTKVCRSSVSGSVPNLNFVTNAPSREHNTFHDLAFETADVGAFYSCGQAGTGWASPANVVRFNSFYDILRFDGVYDTTALVSSVYLDDQMSFYVVSNNTFNNVQHAIEIGGGRSNIITGNVFNATYRVLYIDARGCTWQKDRCSAPKGDLWQGLESAHYDRPPWSAAFPFLQNISLELPCFPAQTQFSYNTFCNSTHGSSWYVLWSCLDERGLSCSNLNTKEASSIWHHHSTATGIPVTFPDPSRLIVVNNPFHCKIFSGR